MASEEESIREPAGPSSTTAAESTEPAQPTTAPPAGVTAQAPPLLPVGPEADTNSSDDLDSAFGDGSSRASTSIASSIYDYRVENGRRYHAPRASLTHEYDLPNDEIESDRLDLQHQVFFLTFHGELSRAPLEEARLHEVLDVGTGTGIWAIDFADAHPAANVTGTDLSPIQPPYVPPNCRFYIDDYEAEWAFSNPFDYIHARMIVVATRDWARFFRQAYQNLNPGGWLEVQDLTFPLRCDDGTAGPETPAMQWSQYMIEGAARLGVNLSAGRNFAQLAREAGFVDFTDEQCAWPINRWPKDKVEKEKGIWVLQNFLDGLQGFSMGYYTRGLQWSKDEVDVFVARVKTQLKDRKSHVYLPINSWYMRKPER